MYFNLTIHFRAAKCIGSKLHCSSTFSKFLHNFLLLLNFTAFNSAKTQHSSRTYLAVSKKKTCHSIEYFNQKQKNKNNRKERMNCVHLSESGFLLS